MKEDVWDVIEANISLLGNLVGMYRIVTVDAKRQMVGSIFTAKLVYEENAYRTPVLHLAVEIFQLNISQLEE